MNKINEIIELRLKTIAKDVNNSNDYIGFDMSGYNNSTFKNIELLSKFTDLFPDKERDPFFIFPLFWKGRGIIVCNEIENFHTLEEITGQSTTDIIQKIIFWKYDKLSS